MSQPRNITHDYPVEAMLASAPQSTVYRSTDPSSGRPVVVKLLSAPGDGGSQHTPKHFLRAMGAVQFLRLPAFPDLYEFGIAEDQNAYMVMEWIEGISLAGLKGSPPQRVLPILDQVVESLEALAMGEVFHHNLSPSNILVTAGTEREFAKIIGFGTSAFFTGSTAGTMLGHSPDSDAYSAPERLDPATEDGSAGADADIYSVALLAAEILGGTLNSDGPGGPSVHFDQTVRSRIGAPDHLEKVLNGALRIEAGDRTTSYPHLRVAFEAAAVNPTNPPPSIPPEIPSVSETTIIQPPPIPAPCDETVVSAAPTGAVAANPDLDDTAATFDPNKTDPVILPERLVPPPVTDQPPPIATDPPSRIAPVGKTPKKTIIAVAIAVAVFVTLVIAGGIVLLLRLAGNPTEPTVAEIGTPTPAAITPIPQPTPLESFINAALEEADALLSAGDIEGARAALAGIPQETVDDFTDEESELFNGITAALTGTRLDAAVSDLDGGLRHGSIRMLRRAIAGFSNLDPADYSDRPDIGRKLAQARAALDIHTRLWKAHESGHHAEVLELAAAMIDDLPDYSTSYTFREEAASALEKESDTAAVAGDLDEAESLLEPIRSYWPDREGLRERLATITTSREQVEAQLAVIETALSRGWEGKPAAGLEVLNSTSPMPLLEQRFTKTRTLLEEQLADLDAEPPRLELAGDTDMSFKKKKSVSIDLIITDDYRVENASGFLRNLEDSTFKKIALEKAPTGDRYRLVVTPELHNNEGFFVYFEASDLSGHTARLGEPQAPLEFTRKKGLKAIFGK